ncbi:hypothetical protein J2046_003049 [Rhizobium petrolearium]|uniref:hypothetical protein n=1 Tax=Neorhizobium petrolearium TaxID=515361 RepID=UPI001AE56EA1|nr:hypothetical protein [Neorhizobium petrolearium]MBP1844782.1 hypothetical protein [Neorhizobium petrolearium]
MTVIRIIGYVIGAVVLLGLLGGMLALIMFGGEPGIFGFGGNWWRKQLYDFQTLITGILAVSAAGATVWQMRATDRENERRHRQLVTVSLRSDRLSIERMLIPQFGELKILYKDLKNAPGFEGPSDGIEDIEAVVAYAKEGRRMFNGVEKVIDRPHWAAAEKLFGGLLTFRLVELRERLERAQTEMRQLGAAAAQLKGYLEEAQSNELKIRVSPGPSKEYLERKLKDVIESIERGRPTDSVARGMEPVFQELYKLADAYEIKL